MLLAMILGVILAGSFGGKFYSKAFLLPQCKPLRVVLHAAHTRFGQIGSRPTTALRATGVGKTMESNAIPETSCSCGWCTRRQLTAALVAPGFAATGLAALRLSESIGQATTAASQRFFVQQMRGMADYERLVASKKAQLFRSALSGMAPQRVVEVGVGTGVNFAFLRDAGVREVIAVEPNLEFLPVASAAADNVGMQLQVREGVMEQLPIATGSVDAVVATLVLCSVKDVAKAVAEAHRVLRPGGRYIFTEHVAAPADSMLRVAQGFFDPMQKGLAAGCSLTGQPLPKITSAFGASNTQASHWSLSGDASSPLPPHFLLSPHLSGFAEKVD